MHAEGFKKNTEYYVSSVIIVKVVYMWYVASYMQNTTMTTNTG